MANLIAMTDIVPSVGELEICRLCEGSPHLRGCPRHEDFDNERIVYVRSDAPDELGTAAFWVHETFEQAALDSGESKDEALREGIQEFEAALRCQELQKTKP